MNWQEYKIEDIAPQTAEQKQAWLDWLKQRRVADIKAQQDFQNVLISWNSPSGFIRYAKP